MVTSLSACAQMVGKPVMAPLPAASPPAVAFRNVRLDRPFFALRIAVILTSRVFCWLTPHVFGRPRAANCRHGSTFLMLWQAPFWLVYRPPAAKLLIDRARLD